LQRGARGIGEFLPRFIAIATEVQHEATDRICGIDAIIENGIPRGIAFVGLIMAECFQQIGEGLVGNVLRNDCFAKRDEDGVRRATFIAGVEFLLPPAEQFQSASRIGNFVA